MGHSKVLLRSPVGGTMAPMSSRVIFLRWVPALFIMGLIFVLSSLSSDKVPYYGSFDYVLKKSGHALGYGLLGLSYYYALPRRLSVPYRFILALIMAFLFALSDEYHQSFVEGRNSSLSDVAIDTAGAFFALLLGAGYSSNSKPSSNF
jgi:VanZ family protein